MTGRDIQQLDPPPHPWKRYDWPWIAQVLRNNPGKWYKIFERDRSSLAVAIRLDSINALPIDEFEVTTRNNTRGNPRMCTLYMRYNPWVVQNRLMTRKYQ